MEVESENVLHWVTSSAALLLQRGRAMLCVCHIYMSVDLAEASSRVLVDTALWFTVSEARDWSDSRAWPPFCLARVD